MNRYQFDDDEYEVLSFPTTVSGRLKIQPSQDHGIVFLLRQDYRHNTNLHFYLWHIFDIDTKKIFSQLIEDAEIDISILLMSNIRISGSLKILRYPKITTIITDEDKKNAVSGLISKIYFTGHFWPDNFPIKQISLFYPSLAFKTFWPIWDYFGI